jgi:hypothetical protein
MLFVEARPAGLGPAATASELFQAFANIASDSLRQSQGYTAV